MLQSAKCGAATFLVFPLSPVGGTSATCRVVSVASLYLARPLQCGVCWREDVRRGLVCGISWRENVQRD